MYLVDGDKSALSWEGAGLSVAGGIVKFMANIILKAMATCGPCHKERCHAFKTFCKCCGKHIICFWSFFILSVLVSAILITISKGDVVYFIEMFVMTTVFDWFIGQIILLTIKFQWMHGREIRNVNGKLNKLSVDYIEYELYINKVIVDQSIFAKPRRDSKPSVGNSVSKSKSKSKSKARSKEESKLMLGLQ